MTTSVFPSRSHGLHERPHEGSALHKFLRGLAFVGGFLLIWAAACVAFGILSGLLWGHKWESGAFVLAVLSAPFVLPGGLIAVWPALNNALESGKSSRYARIESITKSLSQFCEFLEDLADTGQSVDRIEHHADHYFDDHW